MRVTIKYLIAECNKILERLECDHRVVEIYRTYHRKTDYEAGAAYFIVKYGDKEGNSWGLPGMYGYIFYPISYLQKELNNGYELYYDSGKFGMISGSQFDIRKIS